jgi:hypothetical protein
MTSDSMRENSSNLEIDGRHSAVIDCRTKVRCPIVVAVYFPHSAQNTSVELFSREMRITTGEASSAVSDRASLQ